MPTLPSRLPRWFALVVALSLSFVFSSGCGDDSVQIGKPQPNEPDDPPNPPPKPGKPMGPIKPVPSKPVEPPDPEEPPVVWPDPWPKDDVRVYGAPQGLPGRVTGVGLDDAKNVYVIDGSAAYAMRVGNERFVRTDSGGQFERGYPVASVAGGREGEVFLGFMAWEGHFMEYTEDDKMFGDVDRMKLNEDGTLSLDFHYKIQNNNAIWIDETRSIHTMTRVVGGANHGDIYLGSNHGVTILRGDVWADHRHTIFLDETGSMVIGYIYDVNMDSRNNLLFSGHWKIGATPPPPADDLLAWLDGVKTPWLIDTWPEHLGNHLEPKLIHAIAGEIDEGVVYIGTWGTGMHAMQFAPRAWWTVDGCPDTHINSLRYEPEEGKMWVGTRSRGLWRWEPATGNWEQSPFVPDTALVHQILIDHTVEPRAVYVATDRGLFVIRAP